MDYANGKIYKLVSPHTTKVYVGSTCSTLTKRKAYHKTDHTKWKKGKKSKVMSCELYDLGIDDVDIILIEKFPCADKMELLKRERYWIEKLDCCNKKIPTRTQKEYNEANKEAIAKKKKEWCEANKEAIAKYGKEYREANKKIIKMKASTKVTCECGVVVRKQGISQHKKTKKHNAFYLSK